MANALYNKGREAFLKGQINWIDDVIKVALVKTTSGTNSTTDEYKANLTTHQYLSDVPANSIIQTQTLASRTAEDGVADASNATFTDVPAGIKIGAIIIFKQSTTGDRETSRLIAFLDGLNGLPHDSVGGNITIQWDSGINKIFKL